MPRLPEGEVDNKEKLWNLSVELKQAELDRKESGKAHADNIKRIKDEIKEVLEEEEDSVVAAQTSPGD